MNTENFINETKLLGISLTEKQKEQLEKFYYLLIYWNQKINLTRITQKQEVYLKHFYDSLTLAKEVDLTKELNVCDVGSGAGFPGIVLKIAYPNLKITLLDSLQKRVNYLNEIIKELNLKEIQAFHIRAEEYAKIHRESYDIVTARAVTNLKKLSELCIPMVKENGYFISMKANAKEEIEEARDMISLLGGKIKHVNEFLLPIENSTRTLIKIEKIKPTNKKYPRNKIK